MKQTRLTKILAAGVACVVAVATVTAQESTTTTTTTKDPLSGTTTTASSTTTSAGTITAYTPGTDYISFRTTTDTAPVKYYYTKSTTVLDPEGRTVTWSAVRPDMPATVYYVREGDRVVASKIVLSKAVAPEAPAVIEKTKETSTTTTTTKP